MGNYIFAWQSTCISENFQTHTFRYIFNRFVYLPWKKKKKKKDGWCGNLLVGEVGVWSNTDHSSI